MKFGFGVDLGGTTVKIAYFDEQGTMLEKWEIPTVTADGGKQILPDIAASIRTFLDSNNIADTAVLGIGIGVPGPVNAKGVVNKCVNLGWGVFSIADELSKLTGFPVKAGNDANVAAMGEYWKGGGQGCENMAFVTLGTGVGGGIVIDGHLLHGTHGAGAEVGHMVLNPHETAVCGCGKRGCVEQYCSATGLVRLAGLKGMENVSCKDIFDAGKDGDKLALEILEQDAGLHFLLKVRTGLSDRELTEKLAQRGIRVRALSHYYHGENQKDTRCLVVNYAGLNEEVLSSLLASLPEEIRD